MIDLSSGRHETKYMVFSLIGKHGQLQDWEVSNKKGAYPLGQIGYLFAWHQYVFMPGISTEFNNSCLTEITEVLSTLNKTTHQGKD